MQSLVSIDKVTSEIAAAVYAGVPMDKWQSVKVVVKCSLDGGVRGRDYDFYLEDGTVDQGSSPHREPDRRVDKLALQHWQLTQDLGQPRWFKMIVTVQCSGKFSVDFEYKDHITDLDMVERG
jgi:hypothetical protein